MAPSSPEKSPTHERRSKWNNQFFGDSSAATAASCNPTEAPFSKTNLKDPRCSPDGVNNNNTPAPTPLLIGDFSLLGKAGQPAEPDTVKTRWRQQQVGQSQNYRLLPKMLSGDAEEEGKEDPVSTVNPTREMQEAESGDRTTLFPEEDAEEEEAEEVVEGLELEYIESDASFCMPDLGSEIVVVSTEEGDDVEMAEEEEDVALRLGAGGRVDYSRRVSYEEMVHRDDEEDCDNSGKDVQEDDPVPSMQDCLAVLTRWALNLQELYDERQDDSSSAVFSPHDAKTSSRGNGRGGHRCRCETADALVGAIKAIEDRFYEAIELHDKTAVAGDSTMQNLQVSSLMGLAGDLRSLQEKLRSSVSILLSSERLFLPSSKCGSESARRALRLVEEVCDVRGYVRDAADSLVQLVCELMGVGGCARHEVSDRAIVDVLAGLERQELDDDDEGDDDAEDKENVQRRKRKSSKKSEAGSLSLTSSPSSSSGIRTSPTSSPSKRPRRARTMSMPVAKAEVDVCLRLLETKRKAMRGGLRQYVLWKETLKAEKDRRLMSQLEDMEEDEEERQLSNPFKRLSYH